MDETAAKAWLRDRFGVSRETFARLEAFQELLLNENKRHNLVSAASLSQFWARHIADSAQLLLHAPDPAAPWVDLGTGAGFPGLVIALLHHGPVTLIEERRLRVEFLREAAAVLQVEVDLLAERAERVGRREFDVISARAFAPLPRLLAIGSRFSTAKTVWVLPKGQKAETELAALDSSWQGEFRFEPSLTDADARILIATGVERAKGKFG